MFILGVSKETAGLLGVLYMKLDSDKHAGLKFVRGAVKGFIVLFVLAVGAGVGLWFVKNKPQVQRRGGAVSTAVLVKIQGIKPENYRIVVEAMGTVAADTEVALKPRVTGEVISLAPECTEGGYFKKDEEILKIDPQDYEIALREIESKVVEKNKELKVEMGMQEVSRREFEILKEEGYEFAEDDSELVLRQPQLRSIKAQLEAAKASREKAKLDLKRTSIRAPFNGQCLEGNVELGSQVDPQTKLITLVGTDAYEINITVPVSDLKWIDIPAVKENGKGAEIKVFNVSGWGKKIFRKGYITKLIPELETQGRLAKLTALVEDPLGLEKENQGKPTLLIGMYVTVKIKGKLLKDVYVIPRRTLHEGNFIWVADKEDKLRIKNVDCLRRDRKQVAINDGINEGDRLIVSDIAAPIEGMKLKFENSIQPETNQDQSATSPAMSEK